MTERKEEQLQNECCKTVDACDAVECIRPSSDIEAFEGYYQLSLDMPGLNKDDIDIKLENHCLAIAASASIEGLRKRKYYRCFKVMKGLEANQVQADYREGVLRIKIDKAAAQERHQIQVQYA